MSMSSSNQNTADALRDLAKFPEEMAPLIQSLEAVRQEYLRKKIKANRVALIGGVIGALVVIAMFALGTSFFATFMVAFFIILVLLIVHYSMLSSTLTQYNTRFKFELFTQVTKRIAPEIDYQPHTSRSEEDLKATGLINSRIDRFSGQDYFSGKYGDTQMGFSEVHAERRETRSSGKGRTRTEWVTVFDGIFFSADFHKHFQGQVLIVPDIAESTFGWLGRKVQGLSSDLVRLENPVFENAFKVSATDQVEARYLLTPTMQERLLELQNSWGRNTMVSLQAGWVHVLIPSRGNWFECDPEIAANDLKQIQTFADQLLRLLKVIDTLDLNTRLWTKS
jgi:uncharacterized membrane protein